MFLGIFCIILYDLSLHENSKKITEEGREVSCFSKLSRSTRKNKFNLLDIVIPPSREE